MDTGKRDLQWFIARLPEGETGEPQLRPGDLSRMSIEAMTRRHTPEAAAMPYGDLRMHGDQVTGHAVPLAHVGRIASSWQRAISAVGAAMEGVKSLSGRVSKDLQGKTEILLTASPIPGSVVLRVEPAELRGSNTLATGDHGLADRASRQLVEFVGRAGESDSAWLSDRLRDLGPRASSAVKDLAKALSGADVTIDVRWTTPGDGTASASLEPGGARWLHEFVRGESLDTEQEWMSGILITVSSEQLWRIALDDGDHRNLDARHLPEQMVGRWHVGQNVFVHAQVEGVEQPDGEIKRRYKVLDVTEDPPAP